MNMVDVKALTQEAYARLRKLRSDLVGREGQRVMIGRIAQAVSAGLDRGLEAKGQRLLAIHAPTGSGKTLAYGIGVLPAAKAAGKKVVISTSTVALQEQVLRDDAPWIADAVGGVKFGVALGRARYTCPVRLRKALAMAAGPEKERLSSLVQALDGGKWNGLRDSLSESVDDVLWMRTTNDANGCQGRTCPERAKCPFVVAREGLAACDAIVTNHDLLLADLTRESGFLPDAKETVYVIDEAHSLPERGVRGLASGFALLECVRRLARLCRAFEVAAQVLRDEATRHQCEVGAEWGSAAQLSVGRVGEELLRWAGDAEGELLIDERMMDGAFGNDARTCVQQITRTMDAVLAVLAALRGKVGEGLRDRERADLIDELGEGASAVSMAADTLGLMCSSSYGEAPVARWLYVDSVEGGKVLRLFASPTTAAQKLEEALWSKACAAILCSATLKGVGGFKGFLRESGLDRKAVAQTLEVESPFNLNAQAKLVVPKMGVSAKDAEAHTACLIEMVPLALRSVRTGSGALMIFSSLKQMREVANGMPDDVKATLLVQGELPKAALLLEHKRRVESGRSSVIFGSQTMEEGVDLPGRLCEMVLIAKLPFSVPTGAVETVRKRWIERKGSDYFREVAVPNACRRLAQEAGRLIRTESDRGSIVIFDERLTDTGYGKEILAALDGFRVERRLPGQVEVPW